MKPWRFLTIFWFFMGCILSGLLVSEARGERKYTSPRMRISVIVEGQYEAGTGAGGFTASYSGKRIGIDFSWTPLKVYSGKKEIKSNISPCLRERLKKGKRIEVVGRWTNVITTDGCKLFEADIIYFPPAGQQN